MAPPHLTTTIFLLPLLLSLSFTTSTPTNDLISELQHLQSGAPNGVLRLTDHLLGRILSLPRPRPFSLLIFFDATQLHDKSELQLPTLKSEFSILSKSFLHNNKDSPDSQKLFFCDIEFKDSQRSFSLFGVNSLPHIRLVSPHVENLKNSDHMDQGDFSRLAESMSEFVESKTKLTIGPLQRPPMFSGKQITFFLIVLMIWAPFAVKKIIAGQTLLHDYKLWLFSAIFVYFVSVSGTMHNIIRKMPMFITDRNDPTKMVFFYQGSGMQLGAEGFAVGSLYTVVGLLLGFVTHGLVKVRSVTFQRFAMAVALIVSFWAVKKVVYLDNWKTGYGIHAYWPSSW
ncbi:probable dolichyl-diphosphooligosaccharide--protein glycosyltransferase subunit 3B [Chenopodium quinoa]|nr:probable dolichyl-diphosphooligosaccharide--protein glycosyltransferase subunit 3B [Chenopodium quinoa]